MFETPVMKGIYDPNVKPCEDNDMMRIFKMKPKESFNNNQSTRQRVQNMPIQQHQNYQIYSARAKSYIKKFQNIE